MKKEFSIFIVLVILVLILSSNVFAAQIISFKDVPKSHWANSVISEMASSGYFKGYPSGKFLPDNKITRAEFISLFDNIVKKNFTISKSSQDLSLLNKLPNYKDLPSTHWAYNSVKNLWFYGRVFDKSDIPTRNTIDLIFGKEYLKPDQSITRAEVSALLYKLVDDSQVKLYLMPAFKDSESNKFAYQIQVLNTLGIISGYPDNTFKPNQGIKRSEAAAMLKRLIDSKESFKKVVWTETKQYAYDLSLATPVDVVKKVFQLELGSRFDEAYIYYSNNSKEKLGLKDYKDYMTNINLHISKDISYWSWERVNLWTEFTVANNNSNESEVKYVYTLEDDTTREGTINLEKQDGRWYVVLPSNQ